MVVPTMKIPLRDSRLKMFHQPMRKPQTATKGNNSGSTKRVKPKGGPWRWNKKKGGYVKLQLQSHW